MHLALITTLPPSRATLNEYGGHLATALARHPGVRRLTILADRLDDAAGEELPLPPHVEVRRVWRFGHSANPFRIERELRRCGADAALFNLQFATFARSRVPAALGLLAPAASRMRRPTITLLHNIVETVDLDQAGFGGNPLGRAITTAGAKLTTRALLASDRLALTLPRYVEIVQKEYGAEHVMHVPHGVFADPGPVAPLPDRPTVMTFGKFGTYKRVEVLIEAHRRLLERDPRVRLVVAGSDSPNAPGYLARMQAAYAQVPNLTFTGYVAEDDVPRVFADSTVVAFPYQSTTGSSGVLHFAGQYGRAAVMPRIGDLAELAEIDGYQFADFAPDDDQGLARALASILFDPARARSMGAANRVAAAGMTIDDVAGRYVEALHDVQEERHAYHRA